MYMIASWLTISGTAGVVAEGNNKEKGEKDPEDMRSECSADYEGYDGDGSRVIAESR